MWFSGGGGDVCGGGLGRRGGDVMMLGFHDEGRLLRMTDSQSAKAHLAQELAFHS